MSGETITIKYHTVKQYCPCCSQKLPEAKTSRPQEFEFSKEGALGWTEWDDAAKYPEDMERLVPEYVYDAIRFYALDSSERVIVEDSEIEKVKEFIINVVVSNKPSEGEDE